MPPRFHRTDETDRRKVHMTCDGSLIEALEGDTVLTALLLAGRTLRTTEFDKAPRAGFCLMEACQDCILWTGAGARVRACATPVSDGLSIFTVAPEGTWPPVLS